MSGLGGNRRHLDRWKLHAVVAGLRQEMMLTKEELHFVQISDSHVGFNKWRTPTSPARSRRVSTRSTPYGINPTSVAVARSGPQGAESRHPLVHADRAKQQIVCRTSRQDPTERTDECDLSVSPPTSNSAHVEPSRPGERNVRKLQGASGIRPPHIKSWTQ